MSEVYLDPNYTCIAFLGDKSGSMVNFNTKEFADSINNIIYDNLDNSNIIFYGATFSDTFDFFADGIDGRNVNIKEEDLKPNGLTALVPSFARMIRIVGSRLEAMKDRRPSKVIFILLSDGEQTVGKLKNNDNFDKMYEGKNGIKNLRKLVSEHENIWKWEFMFLGTNFDSITVGKQMGLNPSSCLNYSNNTLGLKSAMRCVSRNVTKSTLGKKVEFTDNDRNEANNNIVRQKIKFMTEDEFDEMNDVLSKYIQ